MEKLIYQTSPKVTLATNTFLNVPVILQYDDTPLIEIVNEQSLGYTTKIPIYHPDGTYLAKVNGTRVFPTEEGKKAGIKISNPVNMTVCKMDNKTLFEIHHEPGDAFRTMAELYTPTGCFVKCSDSPTPDILNKDGSSLQIGGMVMSHCSIVNMAIGVLIKSNGSMAIGVS